MARRVWKLEERGPYRQLCQGSTAKTDPVGITLTAQIDGVCMARSHLVRLASYTCPHTETWRVPCVGTGLPLLGYTYSVLASECSLLGYVCAALASERLISEGMYSVLAFGLTQYSPS